MSHCKKILDKYTRFHGCQPLLSSRKVPGVSQLYVQCAYEYDSEKKKRERDCTIYRQPLGWNSKALCRVKEDSLQRRTLYHSIYMTFPEDRKKKSDVEQISA